jgi:hypothetical protein
MHAIVHLAFVALAIFAAMASALADPPSTDSKLSPECRTARELAASSASRKFHLEIMESHAADIEASEKQYFDRFDAEKTISLTGAVTEFRWSAPRAQIMLSVSDDGRGDQLWTIEMASPSALVRLGWRHKSLSAAMPITVMIRQRRDGSNGGYLLTATLPDGKLMSGGRDRPGRLQELRDLAAAADAASAEFVKTHQLFDCGL